LGKNYIALSDHTNIMASLSVQLTAPNGRVWSQPTGLFINNKWVKSSDGEKIASINPSYVSQLGL
jgi:aldehyde dehydrogenase (NAD(P)+)